MTTTDIFGYYDRAAQEHPAYDPGLDVLCPHCLHKLDEHDLRTYSLMLPGDSRSFFYRVHHSCDSATTEAARAQIEYSLIDVRATQQGAA